MIIIKNILSRQYHLLFAIHLFFLYHIEFILSITTTARCPHRCSGHGSCDDYGSCNCYPTYIGYDCSLRICPSSSAWVDIPTDSITAHANYTECSNMVMSNSF